MFSDATKRAIAKHDVPSDQPVHVHSTSDLKEFIRLAEDPEVLGNLLDMKATMAPIPAIISYVFMLLSSICVSPDSIDGCLTTVWHGT
jgi:hypothetical protein